MREAAHSVLRRLSDESLQCAEAGDGDGFRKLDAKLHAAIAEASGNELLERLAGNAYTLVWALRRRDTPSIGYQVGCAQEHLRIVEAIADRVRKHEEQLRRLSRRP